MDIVMTNLKLYRISQSVHNDYDTYDSAVVCALDEETARDMSLTNSQPIKWDDKNGSHTYTWAANRNDVLVEFLGEASDHLKQGVICASFNAG